MSSLATTDAAAASPTSTARRPGPALPEPDFGPTDRRTGWIVTGVVALIAALTRFIALGSVSDGGTPIFDEKHYAPQAFQFFRLGIEENPAYGLVVHPPVAKEIQSIGAWLFGYTPMGWRFTAAIAGVLIIVIVTRMVRRLTRSSYLGGLAGLLLCCDGVLFVTSRVGMLDVYQVLFVVAAAALLLVDRDQMRARMHAAALAGRVHLSDLGPRLGFRWYRFAAGLMLGLAAGVKWSGLYYIAVFGVISVCFDIAVRARYGVRRPVAGMLLRDAIPAFASLVIWPAIVYMLSWLPWFANENSVYRHSVSSKLPADWSFGWLPDSLQSWLYYQSSVMEFHSSLTTSSGALHPWESKPWAWPMSLRPMLYYYEQGEHVTGCGQDECVQAIMLNGTPMMWWLAIPVLAFALWRTVFSRDGRYAFALAGYLAGIVPWFFLYDRQMYFFYGTLLIPFLVIMLVLILGEIAGIVRPGRRASVPLTPQRRRIGLAIVCVYVALVVGNFAYMYPTVAGVPITLHNWQMQQWLPSWR